MASTSLSKAGERLARTSKVIPRSFDDRFGILPLELTPDQLRNAKALSSLGELGPLQMIYILMDTDSRFSGIVNSLKSAVAMCPLKWTRPKKNNSRGAKTAEKVVNEQFKRINVVRLIKQLTRPYFTGVSIWENEWRLMPSSVSNGRDLAFFRGIRWVSGSRYRMEMDPLMDHFGEVLITSMEDPLGSPVESFQPGALSYMDDGTDPGFFDMAGVARSCLGWWLSKVYTQIFWTQHNETFGQPARVAYVPNNVGAEEKKKVEKFLQHLGRYLYAIFEEDIEIDLLHAVNTGTVTTFKELIGLANAEMAVAVHGQVQTVDGGEYGSYAKAQVQFRVRREIVMLVCVMVIQVMKEIVKYMCEFNIDPQFDPDDMPEGKIVVPRAEERVAHAEFFDIVTDFMEVNEDQIREELELDPIDEDDPQTIGPSTKSRSNGEDQRNLDQSGARDRANSRRERNSENSEPDGPGRKGNNREQAEYGNIPQGRTNGIQY